jgi:hypothetical protein
MNEPAHGHGLRHCRYRGQPKAHLQHVLTAIAVSIDRLSQLPPGEITDPRPHTASQKYLDHHDCAHGGPSANNTKIPDRVKLRAVLQELWLSGIPLRAFSPGPVVALPGEFGGRCGLPAGRGSLPRCGGGFRDRRGVRASRGAADWEDGTGCP